MGLYKPPPVLNYVDSSLFGSEVAEYGSNRSSMADDQHRCLILVHGPQEADKVREEALHI